MNLKDLKEYYNNLNKVFNDDWEDNELTFVKSPWDDKEFYVIAEQLQSYNRRICELLAVPKDWLTVKSTPVMSGGYVTPPKFNAAVVKSDIECDGCNTCDKKKNSCNKKEENCEIEGCDCDKKCKDCKCKKCTCDLDTIMLHGCQCGGK